MKVAARQTLRTATATQATATASRPGTSESALIARAGPGMTSIALSAVKWCKMIASVSRAVIASVACGLLWRAATVKAPTASRIAIALDAVRRLVSQFTLHGASMAHI